MKHRLTKLVYWRRYVETAPETFNLNWGVHRVIACFSLTTQEYDGGNTRRDITIQVLIGLSVLTSCCKMPTQCDLLLMVS